MKYFAQSLAVFLCFSACKQREFNQADTQIVIGKDDRVGVSIKKDNLPPGYGPLVDAVGVIRQQNKKWANGASTPVCTAFHIGGGIVVTAGHCLVGTAPKEPPLVNIAPRKGVLFTDFNYFAGGTVQRSQILNMIYVRNTRNQDGIDVGLFEISNPPKAALRLNRGPRPPVGTKISMIASNEGSTLMWSGFCELHNRIYSSDLPEFEFELKRQFAYKCDVSPGASGAPIIQDSDKSVVGVSITQGIGGVDPNSNTKIEGVEELGRYSANGAMNIEFALEFLPKEYHDRILK
jgi:V8-like Glu-specific endopeptidase